MENILKHD